jgi:general L-amino acid transport system permease protein
MENLDANVLSSVGDVPLVIEVQRPSQKVPPGKWVKSNLFSNWYSSVITVVMAALLLYLVTFLVGWAVDADWEIIRTNLRNFMVGGFPSDELWRPWTSGLLIVAGASLGFGAIARSEYEKDVANGIPNSKPTFVDMLRRFWPILALAIFFVSFARTAGPYIGVAVGIAGLFVMREIGWRLPESFRSRGIFIFATFLLVAFACLAGTGGLLAVVAGIVAAIWAASELGRAAVTSRAVGLLGPIVIGLVTFFVLQTIGLDGFGWDDWGGFHITIFATAVGIATGLPFGILLAIGRRSKLPVIKTACVVFIEFVRGVPLITLLLFSSFMLPLFFPAGSDTRSGLTRAMILITAFSAAYFAEIVRGGLQSVPKGQTEAAQASGMSAGAIQRLIVLPQALRNVIPAMVGQAIALFKDTSLLAIIGIADFFQYGKISNAQTGFLGKGLQPLTYAFIALGYWAVAYWMSRESRRLELKLRVGVR